VKDNSVKELIVSELIKYYADKVYRMTVGNYLIPFLVAEISWNTTIVGAREWKEKEEEIRKEFLPSDIDGVHSPMCDFICHAILPSHLLKNKMLYYFLC
jgi:hypothetical protein